MSKIIITYMDNTKRLFDEDMEKYNIIFHKTFLILKKNDVKKYYIPLCNVKEIEFNGYLPKLMED